MRVELRISLTFRSQKLNAGIHGYLSVLYRVGTVAFVKN